LAREEAEARSLEWKAAKRDRDYDRADSIRSELRAAGYEPDELLEEMVGYCMCMHIGSMCTCMLGGGEGHGGL
jgi:hypothetical protein